MKAGCLPNVKASFQPNKKAISPQRKQAFFVEILKAKQQTGMKASKKESKQESKQENKQENKAEILPAFLLATWNERKLSVHLYGWQPIMMYHNKEELQ